MKLPTSLLFFAVGWGKSQTTVCKTAELHACFQQARFSLPFPAFPATGRGKSQRTVCRKALIHADQTANEHVAGIRAQSPAQAVFCLARGSTHPEKWGYGVKQVDSTGLLPLLWCENQRETKHFCRGPPNSWMFLVLGSQRLHFVWSAEMQVPSEGT